jgi:hypothetical protein
MRASNFVIGVFSVFVLAVGSGATAIAQEKATAPALKLEQKVLIDNDRVEVVENLLKPGAQSESIARPYRVVRAIKGGTLQRIYPDGRKEDTHWKTDEVKVFDAIPPYIVKNVGDSDIVLYIVFFKK